ncbi:Serine/threonine-protein kinase AfsK [Cellulomonas hominis]|nr:Serine/threonine-protein kinase AfsK [Cellulomonas hominis]
MPWVERIGLSPGAEIGGYTILAPLGSGGMGTVYRAVDGGGTAVALKLLHPHIGADPSSRERLRREVLALQRLRHPGVAAVLDAEADSTEAFLVTELVPGQDLAEHVRLRGPLDAAALHRLAAGLRDALEAVHAAGVVHRDLKPSNVLVTPDGPVLIDFGIAQSVDETRVTSAGFVVGTPGYLAPELIDGAEPTPATDWWGWAALLAYASTGRAPFGTRPLEAVLVRTRSGDADLAGLGPVTAGALWDALAADPADRAEPDEVVEALAEAVRRGERYSPEAATVALTAGAALAGGAAAATRAGGTVAFGAGDAAPTLAHPAATGPVPPGALAVAGSGATEVIGAGGWADATGAPGSDGTAVLAPAPTGAQDGTTRAFLPPSVAPGGDRSVGDRSAGDRSSGYGDAPTQVWAADGAGDAAHPYDAPWGSGEPDEGDLGPGVPAAEPPRRTGTVLALALLVVAAAALYPGVVLIALVPLVLLARTVGSVSEALARRRERVGARRSDGLRAVASSPWHLVRALVTLVPSLLVAASLVVITLGVGWWLVGSGTLDAGPLRADADGPTGTAAAVLLAVATAAGLAALWWGPLARTTRTGARRVLGAVAPGRGGATAAVLLALAAAAVLVAFAATGSGVDWAPFAEPSLPTGG